MEDEKGNTAKVRNPNCPIAKLYLREGANLITEYCFPLFLCHLINPHIVWTWADVLFSHLASNTLTRVLTESVF